MKFGILLYQLSARFASAFRGTVLCGNHLQCNGIWHDIRSLFRSLYRRAFSLSRPSPLAPFLPFSTPAPSRDFLYRRAFSLDWPSPLTPFLPFLHAGPSHDFLYRRAFFLGQPSSLTPFLPFLHAGSSRDFLYRRAFSLAAPLL